MEGSELLAGRWRVGAVLGRGAAADVHEAIDVRSGRPVAVKVLRVVDDDAVARFDREIAALRRLADPGIVAVVGQGRCPDGRPYVVLERAEAGTLREAIAAAPGGLGADRAARLGAELAAALAHAHERGIVHRDVKPANVLLRADGRAQLTDFGIAAVLGAATLTASGWALGTPAYLAPEQVRGDRVGPPADVYALGLVVLEAATGERAYPGDDLPAALARLHRPPAVPTTVPSALAAVVGAMTAEAPGARPSAALAAARLGEAAAEPAAVVDAPTAALPVATTPTNAIPVVAPVAVDPGGPAAVPAVAEPRRGWTRPRRTRRRSLTGRPAPYVLAACTATLVLLAIVRAMTGGGGDPADADGLPPDPSVTTSTAVPVTTTTTTVAVDEDDDDDERPGNGNGRGNGLGRGDDD